MSNHPSPPDWINRLLEAICDPKRLEGIQGDLAELYEHRLEKKGRRRANWAYLFDALGFLRPFAWKKPNISTLNHLYMFRNYLKVGLRNLNKHRGYTFINMLGLVISFTCCLLIGLHLQDELSFDRYHEKHDRLFRLANHTAGASYENGIAKVSEPWAPEAKATIPEIEDACRFVFVGQSLFTKGDQQYYEHGGLYTDPSVFNMFSWNLLEGDPDQVLTEPNSIVLTQTLARKYFPSGNALGESLTIDNEQAWKVTGIVEDIPDNSHFTFNFLVSLNSYTPPDQGDKWVRWNQYYSYVLLDQKESKIAAEEKLDQMLDQHLAAETAAAYTPFLQPIASIHLQSKLHREMSTNGDLSYIYIFGIIGLFILLIASSNFVNLSTARATHRAKEVGVRKVIGANRKSLIFQFLSESTIVVATAAVIAIGLARLLLPSLNAFLNKTLQLDLFTNPSLLLGLLAMVLFTGFLAGTYPALVLSSFRPIQVLKGSGGKALAFFKRGAIVNRGQLLRKGLVVFQFMIATFLIIASLVVSGQLKYINNKNLGFNKDQIINIPLSYPIDQTKLSTFQADLEDMPSILNVSASANRPGGSDYGVPYEALGLPEDQQPAMRCLVVDENFLDTYEIKLASGRSFSKEIATDSNVYLINETAAKQLGWDNPLEERMAMPAVDREPAPIIGVVQDFHFHSLHEPITPLYFFMEKTWFSQLNVKLDASRINETLAAIEARWDQFDADLPFRYTFFDRSFGALHAAERRTGRMISILTLLAILITALGLFGLTTYTAEKRTKEMGIRKVFGANWVDILSLFSKEVLVLVGIGVVLATPIAWLVSSNWLDNFAYNIGLGIGFFLLAALLALGIALLTVSYHALTSARRSPVVSIRHEV